MLRRETGRRGLPVEVGQLVTAAGREAYDREAVRTQVGRYPPQHLLLRTVRDEQHDVPGHHRGVERLGIAVTGKVEVSQVGDDPPRSGVVGHGGCDELRVGIHAGDLMSPCGKLGAGAALTASGVEHPGRPGKHRVHQAGLSG